MGDRGHRLRRASVAMAATLALAACSSGSSGSSSTATTSPVGAASTGTTGTASPAKGWLTYFDFNEEEDVIASATGQRAQLIAPWDPNGQMCLMHDGSGRFSVGYNPTLPSQHNPGGLKKYKDPPVGEAIYDRHGRFTGIVAHLAGPYHLPGQHVGEDIPPDPAGTFNDNGTFTGCTFDAGENLFATDLGTAQGTFPTPDSGRLIEWFAPDYTTACVVDGPSTGGTGPHHVDGTGGLRQPGQLAVAPNGDLMLPEAGYQTGPAPGGRVLRLDRTSLPRRAADCGPAGLYPRAKLRTSTFFQGSLDLLPFPLGIARDPTCSCWGIASNIGSPAVAWFDDQGKRLAGRPGVPGESIAAIGKDPNGYNPFGIAFAPDGTLYVVDIHIECKSGASSAGLDCGPTTGGGRLLRFTFDHGRPSPPQVLARGLDFPTNVTVCVADARTVCPQP